MAYVPIPMSPGAQNRPSVRARELGDRLSDLISRYRQEHPELSDREVLQALGVARGRLSGSEHPRPALLAAVLGGVLVLGLTLFFVAEGDVPTEGSVPAIAVAVVMVGLVLVLAAFKARR